MSLQGIKQRYGIIGRSEKLDRALDTATKVANTELSVLIQGESGVGKESFSKIIHDNSKRKHNKFFAINTGAIPSGTINSELFGHEKGAFTGATSERKGYFETVNGGTIFLDEIGEMPLETQSYLLRILENGEYVKVGSSKVEKTDVRVIAATNVNLLDKIKKGKFREDLYYRLNTVPIFVPALHERREDIELLFRKFSQDFAEKYHTEAVRLLPDARQIINNYRWPGNIRELRNVVEQLSIMKKDDYINAEELVTLTPQLFNSNLPSNKIELGDRDHSSIPEREILYKFLFDMKGDLNDLKGLVYELIKTNNLSVNDVKNLRTFQNQVEIGVDTEPSSNDFQINAAGEQKEQPFIIQKNNFQFEPVEEVEENLSLDEKTKELIKKALKKHKNKRKLAAEDLGISERTLYRKIKEYEIKE